MLGDAERAHGAVGGVEVDRHRVAAVVDAAVDHGVLGLHVHVGADVGGHPVSDVLGGADPDARGHPTAPENGKAGGRKGHLEG